MNSTRYWGSVLACIAVTFAVGCMAREKDIVYREPKKEVTPPEEVKTAGGGETGSDYAGSPYPQDTSGWGPTPVPDDSGTEFAKHEDKKSKTKDGDNKSTSKEGKSSVSDCIDNAESGWKLCKAHEERHYWNCWRACREVATPVCEKVLQSKLKMPEYQMVVHACIVDVCERRGVSANVFNNQPNSVRNQYPLTMYCASPAPYGPWKCCRQDLKKGLADCDLRRECDYARCSGERRPECSNSKGPIQKQR